MTAGHKATRPDKVVTTIRIPRDLYELLNNVAEERDTSVSRLLVKAAQMYIPRLPSLDVDNLAS